MESKPDGREYALITRRTVAIIKTLRRNKIYTSAEIAQLIQDKALPEFYLKRFGRQMSLSRTRDYVRYIRDLQIIKQEEEDKYYLDFEAKRTPGQWAQSLSDVARVHMADMLKVRPGDLQSHILERLDGFFKIGQLPKVDNIVTELGIEGARNQEIFRWSLYMYTDGEACRFDIRHYPVLVQRGE